MQIARVNGQSPKQVWLDWDGLGLQYHTVAQPFGHEALGLLQFDVVLHQFVALVFVVCHSRILKSLHQVFQFFAYDGIFVAGSKGGYQFYQAFFVAYYLLVFRVVFA